MTKEAVLISGAGLFISLLLCVYMVNGGLFWSLVPLWMFLGGMLIYVVIERIKPLREKKKAQVSLLFLLAAVTGSVLGLF